MEVDVIKLLRTLAFGKVILSNFRTNDCEDAFIVATVCVPRKKYECAMIMFSIMLIIILSIIPGITIID
jgi:accessory gene regulator protein AgrB